MERYLHGVKCQRASVQKKSVARKRLTFGKPERDVVIVGNLILFMSLNFESLSAESQSWLRRNAWFVFAVFILLRNAVAAPAEVG
jgi:hypothetical protein